MVNGENDPIVWIAERHPVVRPENDDSDTPTGQGLLMLQVAVGRHEHIEPRQFCSRDQIAVGDLIPAEIARERDVVSTRRNPIGTF